MFIFNLLALVGGAFMSGLVLHGAGHQRRRLENRRPPSKPPADNVAAD